MQTALGYAEAKKKTVLVVLLDDKDMVHLRESTDTLVATIPPLTESPIRAGDPIIEGMELIITRESPEILEKAGIVLHR